MSLRKMEKNESMRIGFKFYTRFKTETPVFVSLTVPKSGYKKQLVLFNKVNTLK